MTHLALTDTQALYGAIAFARLLRCAKTFSRLSALLLRVPAFDAARAEPDNGLGLLALLAANRTGHRSLCRLASLAQGHPEQGNAARGGRDSGVAGRAT